jgi:DNA-directed RNA polymerase specialized sigma subunit
MTNLKEHIIASFLYHTIKCDMLKFVTRYCKKHNMLNTISLNYTWDDENNTLGDTLQSEHVEIDEFKILSEKLSESKLKDIKQIMKLHLKGKKQSDIGKELNMSQMTVCRRIKKFKAELIS